MTYFVTLIERSDNTYRAYLTENPVKEFKKAVLRGMTNAKHKPLKIAAIYAEEDKHKAFLLLTHVQLMNREQRKLVCQLDLPLLRDCLAVHKTYENLRHKPLLLKEAYGIDLMELVH